MRLRFFSTMIWWLRTFSAPLRFFADCTPSRLLSLSIVFPKNALLVALVIETKQFRQMATLYQKESTLEITGDVISVTPLGRNQNNQKVFSVVIEDLATSDRNLAQKQDVNRIPVTFFGDWADACCFLATGDQLHIHKFTVDTTDSDPTTPFMVIVNPNSEVTVNRTRRVVINASNVKDFEYQEEAQKQSQTFQSLLVRGHNQFTKIGAYYDAIFGNREEKPRFDFLLSILQGYHANNVLDCACGTGLFSFFLHEYRMAVTGLDCSDIMLDIAKQKNASLPEGRQINFHSADITDFRLTQANARREHVTQTFDCAICLDALQLLPDLEHVKLAIRNMWYHIKTDGHLIIDLPHSVALDKPSDQSAFHYDLVQQNLTALGSPMLLEDGTLEVIRRCVPLQTK